MTRTELLEHEPDVIVDSLSEFRPWLAAWLTQQP